MFTGNGSNSSSSTTTVEQPTDAIVIDLGHGFSRLGYAGEDSPRVVVDSTAAVTDNSSYQWDPFLSSSSPASKLSTLTENNDTEWNWDMVEALFAHSCATGLATPSLASHPILICESPSMPFDSSRSDFTTLLFEKYDVPAVFFSSSAVLTCFSHGRSSGLVVDAGESGVYVTPVTDGRVATSRKKEAFSNVGGALLDQYFLSLVKSQIKTNSESSRIVRAVKESGCRVNDVAFTNSSDNIPTQPFELPDGTKISIGKERFMVPEVLFTTTTEESNNNSVIIPAHKSVQQLMTEASHLCEADVRRELFHNIIVAGGSSCFENFSARLEREITSLVPAVQKIKVISSHPNERQNAAWLGGSILGSLSSFYECWVSKAEYAEAGPSVVQRKCP